MELLSTFFVFLFTHHVALCSHVAVTQLALINVCHTLRDVSVLTTKQRPRYIKQLNT